MDASSSALRQQFSFKTFGLGMAIAVTVFAVTTAILWERGPETLREREGKLASQTVVIERERLIQPFGPPTPEHLPVPVTPVAPVDDQGLQPVPMIPETDEATVEPVVPGGTSEAIADGAPDAVAHAEVAVTETKPPSVALTPAPIDGIYEDTPDGRLPRIRAGDNLKPFDAYRRPFTPVSGRPMISIAVMDIGMSDSASRAVMSEISPDVSVVISPYATNPDIWLGKARAEGHEAWIQLPVETDFYPMNDPGPQTLIINGLEKQNYNKLTWIMSRGSGYAGFVTGNQSAFMRSPNDARPIVNEIYKRGLGFVDGDVEPAPTAGSLADTMNAAYAHNNVWIDDPATPEHIAASLRQLEVLAQKDGSAIGFIRSTPTGLKLLQTWVDGLSAKGISIAPLSAQMQRASH